MHPWIVETVMHGRWMIQSLCSIISFCPWIHRWPEIVVHGHWMIRLRPSICNTWSRKPWKHRILVRIMSHSPDNLNHAAAHNEDQSQSAHEGKQAKMQPIANCEAF